MVIADTSVWVEYIRQPRGTVAATVNELLDANELATVGLVIAEVLQGSVTDVDFDRLERMLVVLPYVETTRESWVMAGGISMKLRQQGVGVPITDIVIAAAAINGDHELFTRDKHFERIPGVRLYQPQGDPDA